MIEEGEIVTHKTKGTCTVTRVSYVMGVFFGAYLLVITTGEEFFESEQEMIKGA